MILRNFPAVPPLRHRSNIVRELVAMVSPGSGGKYEEHVFE